MRMESPPIKGLTNEEALQKLHADMTVAVEDYVQTSRLAVLGQIVQDALSHSSQVTVFSWVAAVELILVAAAFIVSWANGNSQPCFTGLIETGVFLLLITVLNIVLVVRESYFKHYEMVWHVSKLLRDIDDAKNSISWSNSSFPSLHTPLTPCISLQWALREGELVNIPTALLVKGDTVMLRPGHKVPAECYPYVENREESMPKNCLPADSIYSPPLDTVMGESVTSPKGRSPNKPKPHILTCTPFVESLQKILAEAVKRPVSIYQQERCAMSWMLECVMCPVLLFLSVMASVLRLNYSMWYSYQTPSGLPTSFNYSMPLTPDQWEALVAVPAAVLLPIMPVVLPSAWTLMSAITTAVILCVHSANSHFEYSVADSEKTDTSEEPTDEISSTDDSEKLCRQKPSSTRNSGTSYVPKATNIAWKRLYKQTLSILKGESTPCVRSSNITHVLASVTNLCCVDKKGVLSWANPTAEKIFFLRSKKPEAPKVNKGNQDTSAKEGEKHAADDDVFVPHSAMTEGVASMDDEVSQSNSEPVLLSLTHTHTTPFSLSFDDPIWKQSIGSLKPLGLSVLLNTCNPDTQSHYTKLCGHIANEAIYTQDLVPVSQRRCLCALSQQMGFSTSAQSPFTLEHQLSVFRHVPSEFACRERYSRSFRTTKLKFPFPHMLSVLMRDHNTQKLELLTQGTADIVLDSCSDFWDGNDLCPLNDKERKKLLDFYHRTSLSAYCTAFSYRPSPCVINTDLGDLFMELPNDPTHLYPRSPTPHNSTEALFGDQEHTEYEQVHDMEDMFRMQSKQIFIGMVTMQYQARPAMVQMIEQLEGACIRFVHFSKENELRSRVFSEKMGLESGWNCHVSLLDDTKAEDACSSSSRAGHPTIPGMVIPPLSSGASTARADSAEDIIDRCASTGASATPNKMRHSYRSKSLRRKYFRCSRSMMDTPRALCHSAPSTINLDTSLVKFDEEVSICTSPEDSEEKEHLYECDVNILQNKQFSELGCGAHFSPSPHLSSHIASSTCSHSPKSMLKSYISASTPPPMHSSTTHLKTVKSNASVTHSFKGTECHSEEEEQDIVMHGSPSTGSSGSSTCFNFDLSNRARLPKGINNIRPHLRDVDNVPLLVSLFTDCTTQATKQMLQIMQENKEVVLILGSSANGDNVELFINSDASIGIDPLYPVVCMRQQNDFSPSVFDEDDLSCSPTSLAARLYTLPCAFTFRNDQPLSLVSLIDKSRSLLQITSNSLQFWASCSFSLSLMLLLSLCAILPPLLHPVDCLWLTLVLIPSLSLSLTAAPLNAQVMSTPTGKNDLKLNGQLVRYVFTHYGSKFAPSVLVILVVFGLCLRQQCLSHLPTAGYAFNDSSELRNSTSLYLNASLATALDDLTQNSNASDIAVPSTNLDCFYIYHRHYRVTGELQFSSWGPEAAPHLRALQSVMATLILLYFAIISVSFVHRMELVWRKSPLLNRVWLLSLPIVLLLQVVYCACVVLTNHRAVLDTVPMEAWLLAFLWALFLLPLNELLKIREIKANVRYQRKARLEFGTKLGMNSPF